MLAVIRVGCIYVGCDGIKMAANKVILDGLLPWGWAKYSGGFVCLGVFKLLISLWWRALALAIQKMVTA